MPLKDTPKTRSCVRCGGHFPRTHFRTKTGGRIGRLCRDCTECTQCHAPITGTSRSHLCRSCAASTKNIEKHFWSKVAITSIDKCWIWQAGTLPSGYGQFSVSGQNVGAHRFSWQITHGQIPDGLFVCHRCDTPGCCNPSHLFLGTPKDNADDMSRKGRKANVGGGGRGERAGQAKLTEINVREMRSLRESGRRLHELALRFGVSMATVSCVCTRKTWKHVE